ncbi:MAG: hypothetical protein IPO29_17650 [Anaerolineae bacterium]|nr:hypothetical protein [Anaerolineae bacterium]
MAENPEGRGVLDVGDLERPATGPANASDVADIGRVVDDQYFDRQIAGGVCNGLQALPGQGWRLVIDDADAQVGGAHRASTRQWRI